MKAGGTHMNKKVRTKAYTSDDEYYYKIVRKNIKRFRLEECLTQQDLADMTELSREYICDIENDKGNKHFTIAILGRIAEAMDKHIANFFMTDEEESTENESR